MRVNNSQPSFGMALKIPNTKNFSRKEFDAVTMALPELKELAKDVDLTVRLKERHFEVAASGIKSFFQRIFGANESFKMNSHLDLGSNYGVKNISTDLVSAAQSAKTQYLENSFELLEKNLKQAMKPEKLENGLPKFEYAPEPPPSPNKSGHGGKTLL